MSYIEYEFSKIKPADDCRIKITSSAGETRWLSVSSEVVSQIENMPMCEEEE